MLNKLGKYLFRRNRRLFEDLLLEDIIGNIPSSVNEPASEFIMNAGQKMESWLIWQSNILQRKSIAEPHNAEIFRGMLLEIKILLMLAGRKKNPVQREVVEKKEDDPFKGVEEFIHGFKKIVL